MGVWAAVRDVFPQTRWQRDWVHKTINVLDSLPKSVHGRAKVAIKEITCPKTREAIEAIEEFATELGVKGPKAVSKVGEDKEALLSFYYFPAKH